MILKTNVISKHPTRLIRMKNLNMTSDGREYSPPWMRIWWWYMFLDAPSDCSEYTVSKTAIYCLLVIFNKASELIVTLPCPNNHENVWKSQHSVNRYSQGNFILSAAVLFIVKTCERIAKYFGIANIQCITKTSYYVNQRKFLAGVLYCKPYECCIGQ